VELNLIVDFCPSTVGKNIEYDDIFTSILVCLVAVVLIFSVNAFLWLSKRGNHDELFPIVILCLGIPPLGILILFLTFLERYQKEKEQPV
jgi:O-antigen/teichoic acid export membrane protein